MDSVRDRRETDAKADVIIPSETRIEQYIHSQVHRLALSERSESKGRYTILIDV